MTNAPNSKDDDRGTKPEIELASDESWKDQVRRENEQLEAEYRSTKSADGGTPGAPASDADNSQQETERGTSDYMQMPPPTLASLMSILSTQAMIGLGAFADPNDQSSGPQLELAKHFIDLLGVLEEKTAGNLTPDESRTLTGMLHELRMAYVEVSRQLSTPKATKS